MELSSREVAGLFWLGVLLGWVGWKSAGFRESTAELLGFAIKPIFIVPIALFAAYMVLVVWMASWIGLWSPALASDTVVWFVTIGILYLFRATRADREEDFTRRALIAVVSVGFLLELYVNLETFPLAVEMVLVPVAAVLSMVAVVTTKQESQPVHRLVSRLLGVIGVVVIGYTSIRLIERLSHGEGNEVALAFVLPLWLTLAAVPAVFGFGVFVAYEGAWSRLRMVAADRQHYRRGVAATVAGYRLRLRDVGAFAGSWPRRVAEAETLPAAVGVVREHSARMRAREAAEREAAENLVRYAGVDGEDDEGRRLDRREFDATVAALEWIHTCQMGAYQRAGSGRYEVGIVERVLPAALGRTKELPEDHGIQLRVRRDGQAWYAWRSTVSGWVFGIGADGRPPAERFYDGPVPPGGFPGAWPGWREPFERGGNWEPPSVMPEVC
jgi:hypothetical protein